MCVFMWKDKKSSLFLSIFCYILYKMHVLPRDILLDFVVNKVPSAHDTMRETLVLEKRKLGIRRE